MVNEIWLKVETSVSIHTHLQFHKMVFIHKLGFFQSIFGLFFILACGLVTAIVVSGFESLYYRKSTKNKRGKKHAINLIARFTKSSDCLPPAGTLSRDCSPIHGSRIVPGKPGNSLASCFVNRAVTALFTKPSASWLPAIP